MSTERGAADDADLLPARGGCGATAVTPTGTSPHIHVVLNEQGVTMQSADLPSAGHAEVRIVAADPEAARHVAEVLRRCFAATEARSYPAGADGGTRLHLTVDTTHMAEPVRSWLLTSQSSRDAHTQPDEV
jgi:hypothetical protein